MHSEYRDDICADTSAPTRRSTVNKQKFDERAALCISIETTHRFPIDFISYSVHRRQQQPINLIIVAAAATCCVLIHVSMYKIKTWIRKRQIPTAHNTYKSCKSMLHYIHQVAKSVCIERQHAPRSTVPENVDNKTEESKIQATTATATAAADDDDDDDGFSKHTDATTRKIMLSNGCNKWIQWRAAVHVVNRRNDVNQWLGCYDDAAPTVCKFLLVEYRQRSRLVANSYKRRFNTFDHLLYYFSSST